MNDAVGAGAAGVHDPLRDPLVVEVGDLLAQVVVLQQGRAALAGLQRVVGVAQPGALGRRQEAALRRHVRGGTSVSAPVAVRRSGPAWSGFGGSGSRGLVGSSRDGGPGAGAPGTGGGFSSASFASARVAAPSTVALTAFFTALAGLLASTLPPG